MYRRGAGGVPSPATFPSFEEQRRQHGDEKQRKCRFGAESFAPHDGSQHAYQAGDPNDEKQRRYVTVAIDQAIVVN